MNAAFWFLRLRSPGHGAECVPPTEFEEAVASGQLTGRSAMLAAAAGYGSVRYQLSELAARVSGDFGHVRGAGVAVTPGPRHQRRAARISLWIGLEAGSVSRARNRAFPKQCNRSSRAGHLG